MRDLRSTRWCPSLAGVLSAAAPPEVGHPHLPTPRLDAPTHARRGDGGR